MEIKIDAAGVQKHEIAPACFHIADLFFIAFRRLRLQLGGA
jgi:hypothetical protein